LGELDDEWDAIERRSAHRVALLQVYFAQFGLVDAPKSREAPTRVVNAVLEWSGEDPELERRLVKVARNWIRDFATAAGSADGRWVSSAPAVLSKFPSAFLETPLTYRSH
jgi:hypothetical protein